MLFYLGSPQKSLEIHVKVFFRNFSANSYKNFLRFLQKLRQRFTRGPPKILAMMALGIFRGTFQKIFRRFLQKFFRKFLEIPREFLQESLQEYLRRYVIGLLHCCEHFSANQDLFMIFLLSFFPKTDPRFD